MFLHLLPKILSFLATTLYVMSNQARVTELSTRLRDDLGLDKNQLDVWTGLLQKPFYCEKDPYLHAFFNIENPYKPTPSCESCNRIMWHNGPLLFWCVLRELDPDFAKSYLKNLYVHPPTGELFYHTHSTSSTELDTNAKQHLDQHHQALEEQAYNCILWLASILPEWEMNPGFIRLERKCHVNPKWELIPVDCAVQIEPNLDSEVPFITEVALEKSIFSALCFHIRVPEEKSSKIFNLRMRSDDKYLWLEQDTVRDVTRSEHKWPRDCAKCAIEKAKEIKSHLRTITEWGMPLVLIDLCGSYVSMVDWIVLSAIKT
jgi:hypothetical protein